MRRPLLLTAVVIIAVFGSACIFAREIHVSKTGSDSASGSLTSPYLTINKAASIAMPGDTVTIHAGTYREWVKPVRGGTGESKRITYRAAPGEKVIIKPKNIKWVSTSSSSFIIKVIHFIFASLTKSNFLPILFCICSDI